jgi:ABC-type polar amino acid transport system ATPase subunit
MVAQAETAASATAHQRGEVVGLKDAEIKLSVRNLSIGYGSKPALVGVDLSIRENEIFGIIGPANSGKTSFLKALNDLRHHRTGQQRQDLLSEGAQPHGHVRPEHESDR